MHPVGPRSPRTYWLRRVAVIFAAVAVLIGVVFLVAGRSKAPASNTASGLAAYVSGSAAPSLTGVLASQIGTSPPASSPAPVTGGSGTTNPAASQPVAGVPKPTPTTPTTTAATIAPPPTGAPKTTAVTTTAARTTSGKATPGKTTPVTTSPAATTPGKTAPATTTPAARQSTAALSTTAPSRTAVAPSSVPTTPKTTPVTTAVRTATSTAPLVPTTDSQGRLLCSDQVLKLVASTGAPSYPMGSQPTLGVSVTNTGSASCTRDLSGALQVFSVYTAAGARVWSTVDCFPGQGTDVRTLQAGESVHYNIKWSGTTSNPGCTADRLQVPAGSYQVRVTIASLRATPTALTIG